MKQRRGPFTERPFARQPSPRSPRPFHGCRVFVHFDTHRAPFVHNAGRPEVNGGGRLVNGNPAAIASPDSKGRGSSTFPRPKPFQDQPKNSRDKRADLPLLPPSPCPETSPRKSRAVDFRSYREERPTVENETYTSRSGERNGAKKYLVIQKNARVCTKVIYTYTREMYTYIYTYTCAYVYMCAAATSALFILPSSFRFNVAFQPVHFSGFTSPITAHLPLPLFFVSKIIVVFLTVARYGHS